MSIIGQEKLRKWIIQTKVLPPCIMLVGPKGSGKTTLSKYIAECHGMDFYLVPDLKVDNVREVIQDAQALSFKRLYHFELADKMTNQAQNALLKLAEEPPTNAYILLAVENEERLLPTIRSRSRSLMLEPYTKQQLLNAGFEQEIVEVAENIGQAQLLTDKDCSHLYNISQTVVNSIGKASLPNVFNIPKKLEETEYELFLSFLLYHFEKAMKECYQKWHTKGAAHVYTAKDLMQRTTVNKEKIIEMMCVEMWREHRNELE